MSLMVSMAPSGGVYTFHVMQRMGLEPALCVNVCLTIDSKQNFNANVDAETHADVMCKQSFTIRKFFSICVWSPTVNQI